MKLRIPVISFEQPSGIYYVGVMFASDVKNICKVDPRRYDPIKMDTVGGIQRDPSKKRIKEIADYSNTPDAAFPTPIIVAIEDDAYNLDNNVLELSEGIIADIVDGQHRMLGIFESESIDKFQLTVVFLLGATEEQKALLFATINGKQTKVPASLIYDLFSVTAGRSPQKTAHDIARGLNSDQESPWFGRLKMLGRKVQSPNESLSQGTFVKFLLPLISDNPEEDFALSRRNQSPPPRNKAVFNEYWRDDSDEIIYKILKNCFTSIRDTWEEEWNNPKTFLLSKTGGYSGVMRAMPAMVRAGKSNGDLSKEYFLGIFMRVKSDMDKRGIRFTSDDFSTSAMGEAEIRDLVDTNIL